MPDLSGQTLWGRYRVLQSLGRGGMSEVYLAFDQRRQVQVALKLLREDLAEDPEFVRRFRTEAESLARLDHPHIVRFFGFEQHYPLAVLIMSYIPGITLRRKMGEANGPLPLADITGILRQVGAALHYAHGEGIVHRDLKPGNIMLQSDGTALLTDFGIAKVLESATVTTMAVGTPAYMSPEQVEGLPIDPRADIYSLGVLLYEMAVGRRPFTGEQGTGTTTLEKIRDEQLRLAPPDPRQYNATLPDGVAQVILRALAKDPGERWQDVNDMVMAWDNATIEEIGAASSTVLGEQKDNTKQESSHRKPRTILAFLGCPGRKMPSVRQRGDMMLLLAIASGSRGANRPIQGDRQVPLSSVAQHLALAGMGFSA